MPSPSRRRSPDLIDADITAVPWSELRADFLAVHEQGEHIAVIGPTGQGKTTLNLDLLEGMWDQNGASICVLANKRRDQATVGTGWPIVHAWEEVTYPLRVGRRVVVWPPYGDLRTTGHRARKVFEATLAALVEEGAWTLYIDEVPYLTEQLHLRPLLDEYWHTARSSDITVLGSSQEVTWIPNAFRTQQSWLFCFRPRGQEVTKLVAELCGDRDRFRPALRALGDHEFLLVDSLSGDAWVSKVGT